MKRCHEWQDFPPAHKPFASLEYDSDILLDVCYTAAHEQRLAERVREAGVVVAVRTAPDALVDKQIACALDGTWPVLAHTGRWCTGAQFVELQGQRPVLVVCAFRGPVTAMAARIQVFLRKHRGKMIHTCGHLGKDRRTAMPVLEVAYRPFDLLEYH